MKLKELTAYIDSLVPLAFQESYDNSGLQIGNPDTEVNSLLVALDVTSDVVEEAIYNKCDVIISHHPLIFSGIKKITGESVTEKIAVKAIKNNIAIYAAHTNLDNFQNGVSRKMAEKLKLNNVSVLLPLKGKLLKLVTFIPEKHYDNVSNAIFEAGAGITGAYDRCSFASHGTGSFKSGETSKPYIGEKGKIHFEKELRFETVLYAHLKHKVINALINSHPYEEVAYDLYQLENNNIQHGTGCVGNFSEPVPEHDFLKMVSDTLQAQVLRHSAMPGKKIIKVAVCGGAGGSFINPAIACNADAYVTSEIKYHDYLAVDGKILLIDAGHYETEKFSQEIIGDLIIKKFPKFAVRFSKTNLNPINYFYNGKE
ncbi:MAG: Nif3-like dinuclear metal center hexameric protein [Bacteroidales bacterium]|jgi:dinuclear metal center YbgI/SA1388 family protein|nr:Nif3-like dinuclear metal center hexameric protein [Bacteroidales bacterium]